MIEFFCNNLNFEEIHISFDDCNKEICKFNDVYKTIEDSKFFSKLKRLNNIYGAKFSLYIFYRNQNDLPNKFIEILKNENFLSINFHGGESDSEMCYKEFIERCNIHNLDISKYTRLHYFYLPDNLKKYMLTTKTRILFCADDKRNSYGIEYQNYKFNYSDGELEYRITDLRLERSIYNKLVSCKNKKMLVIFGHEDNVIKYNELKKLEVLLKKLRKNIKYLN